MWAPCNVRGLACRNLSVNYEIKRVEPLALISNIREYIITVLYSRWFSTSMLVYYCHDHLGFVFIYTGATSAQSVANVKTWISQITAHALGSNHVLYQHSGRRGPNPLLLESLDHSQVRRLTLYYTAIVVYPISHI